MFIRIAVHSLTSCNLWSEPVAEKVRAGDAMVLLFKSSSLPLGSRWSKLETGAIRQPANAATVKIESDLDQFGENVVSRE
jgi:hypothetical protein